MKILHFSPYPVKTPRHGGQLRVSAIQDYLNTSGFTSINLPFYCKETYTDNEVDQWATRFDLQAVVKLSPSIDVALTMDLSSAVLNDEALYRSTQEMVLRAEPDILCLEQPWLWPLVKQLRQDNEMLARLPLVYSSQNFEAKLYAPILRFRRELTEPEVNRYLDRVTQMEIDLLRSADLTIAVTENDAEDFRQYTTAPVAIVRNGIHPPVAPGNLAAWKRRYRGYKTAFYISSAHAPNAVGVIKMMTPAGYLPPDCRIVIGGQVSVIIREMEKYLTYQGINNSRFDFINGLSPEDLSAVLQTVDVMVLPITEGSGSNLKTAEALYTRKPVLATSVAMRGYEDFIGSPQVCVEDDPDQFRARLVEMLSHTSGEPIENPAYPVESVLWEARLQGLPELLCQAAQRAKGQDLWLFAPGITEPEMEDLNRRLDFYVTGRHNLRVVAEEVMDELFEKRTPVLQFCSPEQVPAELKEKLVGRLYNIDHRFNSEDGLDWALLGKQLSGGANLAAAAVRFRAYVQDLWQQNLKKAYIFGTGPSLEKAIERDWSDGYRIVCNTIVRDPELWHHIEPHFIVAGDSRYHFGHTAFSRAFRRDLYQRLSESKTRFLYPEIFDSVVQREFAGLRDRLLPIPYGAQKRIDVDMFAAYETPALGNVLPLLLLPLASTLSKNVYLWGFDGRAPEEKLFWANSSKHNYPELLPTLMEAHPAFFDAYMPKKGTNTYVKQYMGDELDMLMEQAESRGYQYTMMHPTWTETLQKRIKDPLMPKTPEG